MDDDDEAEGPTQEDVDATVASVEEGLKAAGESLPLGVIVEVVRFFLRYTTSRGKLEREYVKLEEDHRKAMLEKLVREAVAETVDPLATNALHQLSFNERLDERLDQIVRLLYWLLAARVDEPAVAPSGKVSETRPDPRAGSETNSGAVSHELLFFHEIPRPVYTDGLDVLVSPLTGEEVVTLELNVGIDDDGKLCVDVGGRSLDASNNFSLSIVQAESPCLVKIHDFQGWHVNVLDTDEEWWTRRQDCCYRIFHDFMTNFIELEITATHGERVVHGQIWFKMQCMSSL